jgi:hypothetical protein
MMASQWVVWSREPSRGFRPAWVEVDSGSEREAKAGAERRNRSALRLGVDGAEYIALPRGQEPPGWAP